MTSFRESCSSTKSLTVGSEQVKVRRGGGGGGAEEDSKFKHELACSGRANCYEFLYAKMKQWKKHRGGEEWSSKVALPCNRNIWLQIEGKHVDTPLERMDVDPCLLSNVE